MSQLNKIIEACEYASDAYWGNPERFKFKALIDSFATVTQLQQSQERLVRGTFNIKMHVDTSVPMWLPSQVKHMYRFCFCSAPGRC